MHGVAMADETLVLVQVNIDRALADEMDEICVRFRTNRSELAREAFKRECARLRPLPSPFEAASTAG